MRRLIESDDPLIKVAFGTEGGLFNQGLDVPVVICGRGSWTGHKPDEFIDVEQLDACARVLDRLVGELSKPRES